MTIQAAKVEGQPVEYTESGTTTGGAVPVTADDGKNAGRALVEKNEEVAAAGPDAATKRNASAAQVSAGKIRDGQTTKDVGMGITAAAGTVATVGGIIMAGSATIPVFGWIADVIELAVVLVVAACFILIGGIVTAVGQGMINDATKEKDTHLNDVNKGINDAENAGKQAKMLNKKNRVDADRQKLGDLNHEIGKQEEYINTLDPNSPKFKSAQRDLGRMNTVKGQLQSHISEYEASASAHGTAAGAAGAPPTGSTASLAMTPTAAAGDPSTSKSRTTIDVPANVAPSNASTPAPNLTTTPPPAETAAPVMVQ